MIEECEDELICDLAETYRIYDYKSLPIEMVAIFACGLRVNARVWRKISDRHSIDTDEVMIAIWDSLNWLIWFHSKAREDGSPPPEPMHKKLYGKEPTRPLKSFANAADFREAWERMRKS